MKLREGLPTWKLSDLMVEVKISHVNWDSWDLNTSVILIVLRGYLRWIHHLG